MMMDVRVQQVCETATLVALVTTRVLQEDTVAF
jgi:hypothetical protein